MLNGTDMYETKAKDKGRQLQDFKTSDAMPLFLYDYTMQNVGRAGNF